MKKKGFTLIELLVVIAIIAMLMAILMPALSKVKKIAARVVCGTNLKGLGTAQTVYANDYDDEYTVAGAKLAHSWSDISTGWQNSSTNITNTQGTITVGASFYLLVREADVSPKSFVCPSGDEQEFTGKNGFNLDIVDLYDFGHKLYGDSPEGPVACVSYSYHNPYNGTTTGSKGRYAADGTRSAAFAVMADKNPFIDEKLTNGGIAADLSNYMEIAAAIGSPGTVNEGEYENVETKKVQLSNSQPHDREGQNVVFADGHTAYEKRADVGVKNDNIYTSWTENTTGTLEADRRRGRWPGTGPLDTVFVPVSMNDSVLVNDAIDMVVK